MTTGGYGSEAYAASLCHIGTPINLERCDGWVLRRAVPTSGHEAPCEDLVGAYPLFDVPDWSGLAADLSELTEFVSVVAVCDPLAPVERSVLEQAFPDVLRPFKTHHVVDLSKEWRPKSDHRRRARRAHEKLDAVEWVEPGEHLEDWIRLYETLSRRHAITGPAAFGREPFRRLLEATDIRAAAASVDGLLVGMVLVVVNGERSYYHLGAYDQTGYSVGASYALFEFWLTALADEGLRTVDLGGGAGLGDDEADGLARFKRGWANTTAQAMLGGRILDETRYERLCAADGRTGADRSTFFPAYRSVGDGD